MGHYACDMRPEWFGDKPSKTDRCTDRDWVVGKNYEVMTAIEFQNSCGAGQLAFMERMMKKHYLKREDAEVAAREACEAAVESARQQLLRLKRVLKVQRPWEKR